MDLMRRCRTCAGTVQLALAGGYAIRSAESTDGTAASTAQSSGSAATRTQRSALMSAIGLQGVSLDGLDGAMLELRDLVSWASTSAMELMARPTVDPADASSLRDIRDGMLCIGEESEACITAASARGHLRQMDSCRWPEGLGDGVDAVSEHQTEDGSLEDGPVDGTSPDWESVARRVARLRGDAVLLGLERRLRAAFLWDWADELCAVGAVLSPAAGSAYSIALRCSGAPGSTVAYAPWGGPKPTASVLQLEAASRLAGVVAACVRGQGGYTYI